MTPDATVDEILAQTSTRPAIVIADYDSSWPARFDELAVPVRAAIAGLGGRVEHVGSTSVPGPGAKPIIDMDVVVASAAGAARRPSPRRRDGAGPRR